jgi:phospholipase/lecithinase/hemolysin
LGHLCARSCPTQLTRRDATRDANVTLTRLKADPNQITPFPNLTSQAPFGQYYSMDGVHPSAAAHVLIANELIDVINTKYATSIPKLQ